MHELTLSDINNLLDALKVWENEPHTSGFQSSMIGTMLASLSRDEEERKTALAKQREATRREKDQAERASAMRHEESVLLQAKLLTLKRELMSRALQ